MNYKDELCEALEELCEAIQEGDIQTISDRAINGMELLKKVRGEA